MRLILCICFIVVLKNSNGQDTYSFASEDILRNVFQIKNNSGTATAFVIQNKGKEYLVTARHLFSRKDIAASKVELQIMRQSQWVKFTAIISVPSDTMIDIAVLTLDHQIQSLPPFEIAERGDVILGQTCSFFGFPYGIYSTITKDESIPFVKRATISAFTTKVTFLDGMNNPGFSGGPVVIYDRKVNRYKLYGVISGYRAQYNEINISKDKQEHIIRYHENSGIIYCYPLAIIKDLLAAL